MKNKKILVTGGAGFVGTNLIKKLLNEGHTVISIDNYSTGYETNHIDGCTYISGDITNNKVIHITNNENKITGSVKKINFSL